MKENAALFDELLVKYVTPKLKEAGFRKSGRRYTAGQAPGNLVLVQFHLYQNDPDRVGFYIEWSIIPTAVCAHYEERESYKRPMITWGILSDRVDVPPEIATPGNRFDREHWSFPIVDGLDECGAALVRLLDSGQLRFWLDMLDRDEALRQLSEVPNRYGLPTSTPFIMPWRHLAMYIEDGDPTELAGMLAGLEESFADHELVVWWRQRLNARLAATRRGL